MLPPNSRFKHQWDNLMVMLVFYNYLITPLQLGYYQGPVFTGVAFAVLLAIDIVIWLCFVGDVRAWSSHCHAPHSPTMRRLCKGLN